VVVLLGILPLVYLVFEIVFESASVFHHSNWRLSLGLERVLNHVIVTPRMHGIHHSIVERETDSNWGTIFCWWDKIHRSLRRDIPQAEITIGVAAFRDEDELTVGKLLSLPFKEQRPWTFRKNVPTCWHSSETGNCAMGGNPVDYVRANASKNRVASRVVLAAAEGHRRHDRRERGEAGTDDRDSFPGFEIFPGRGGSRRKSAAGNGPRGPEFSAGIRSGPALADPDRYLNDGFSYHQPDGCPCLSGSR